jgi:hypothetical protein
MVAGPISHSADLMPHLDLRINHLMSKAQFDIIQPQWLLDSIADHTLLQYQPQYVHVLTPETRLSLAKTMDPFGDSYEEDVNPSQIQAILERVSTATPSAVSTLTEATPSLPNLHPDPNHRPPLAMTAEERRQNRVRLLQIEEDNDLSMQLGLFRTVVAYVDLYDKVRYTSPSPADPPALVSHPHLNRSVVCMCIHCVSSDE